MRYLMTDVLGNGNVGIT